MEIKWFKKTYKDRLELPIACGIWYEGDAVNYNEPDDKSYTVEWIDENEYTIIKENVTDYFENKYKQERIIKLKEKIYIRQQINEEYTELQTELEKLDGEL